MHGHTHTHALTHILWFSSQFVFLACCLRCGYGVGVGTEGGAPCMYVHVCAWNLPYMTIAVTVWGGLWGAVRIWWPIYKDCFWQMSLLAVSSHARARVHTHTHLYICMGSGTQIRTHTHTHTQSFDWLYSEHVFRFCVILLNVFQTNTSCSVYIFIVSLSVADTTCLFVVRDVV